MPWYSTGTVSVVLNSDTVTGSDTAFSANARAGDAFRGPDGRWYEIGNVTSATVLTIKPAYQGATANGQAYSITRCRGTRRHWRISSVTSAINGVPSWRQ